MNRLIPAFLIPVIGLLAFLPAAHAGDASPVPTDAVTMEPESPWRFELVPYAWMTGLDGETGLPGMTTDVDVDFSDILDNLDAAFSFAAGVRYKRFGVFSDFQYYALSPFVRTPGPLFDRADIEVTQMIWGVAGTYRLIENDRSFLDLTVGARYMDVQNDVTFVADRAPRNLTANSGADWWDTVAGFRARYYLSDRWFLTGLADIGGGSSDLTWQAMLGIGWQWTDNVLLIAAYRYQQTDYSDDDFVFDVATSGPGIGLGIVW